MANATSKLVDKIRAEKRAHDETSARAARDAHARMMRGETELYVYFRPGEIRAFAETEPTEGWTIAWPERVPTHLTADQLVAYFAERTKRVPYLREDRS